MPDPDRDSRGYRVREYAPRLREHARQEVRDAYRPAPPRDATRLPAAAGFASTKTSRCPIRSRAAGLLEDETAPTVLANRPAKQPAASCSVARHFPARRARPAFRSA